MRDAGGITRWVRSRSASVYGGGDGAGSSSANIVDAEVELPDVAGTLKLRSWHHITEEWGVTNDAVGDESLRAPQLGRRMDRDDGRQHLGSRAT